MNINSPIPDQWSQYITQFANSLEVVPAMLYSTKSYVSGVTTELTFFDTAAGSRLDLTNMKQPSQLPNPQSQLIQFIRSKYHTAVQSDDSGTGDATALVSVANDIVQITDGGVVSLTIGEKKYGPWPLWTLATGNFAQGLFASGSDLLADYVQLGGQMYQLTPYLAILPLQNFVLKITWPAGPITLSTGAESEIPIEIVFDGQGSRAVQ
jgi:hypothetical protein